MELRIEQDWRKIDELMKEGLSVGPHVAEVERVTEAFKSSHNNGDPDEKLDFTFAEITHRYALAGYQTQKVYSDNMREYLGRLSNNVLETGNRQNDFVIRTLVYANGAVVLGALAFLSSLNGAPTENGVSAEPTRQTLSQLIEAIPNILVSSSIGFALGLACAYFFVLINYRLSSHYLAGAWPTAPIETVRNSFKSPYSDSKKFLILGMKIRPQEIRFKVLRFFGPFAGWLSFLSLTYSAVAVYSAFYK